MRMECDIVRDLLPLYVEKLVSETSRKAVEEHLEECDVCREICREMMEPDPHIQYDREPAESFHRYVKKNKRKLELKGVGIALAIVLLVFVVRMVLVGAAILWLGLEGQKAEVYEDADVSHYLWYMGEDAQEEYVRKWGMDESIFPEKITDRMNVTDYRMVYYNPWDAQYLSWLVVEYGEEDYEAEKARLQEYDSKEYRGHYGSEGFAEGYEPLATETSDWGMVYALAGEEHEIIYVEIIFPGWFMEIDYQSMLRPEYLPVGFDATVDNPYRRQRLGR